MNRNDLNRICNQQRIALRRMLMTTKVELVQAVKQYARDHYEQGGWDVLIECHSDAEISEAIGKAKTETAAIKNVARAFALKAYDSVRKDVIAAGGEDDKYYGAEFAAADARRARFLQELADTDTKQAVGTIVNDDVRAAIGEPSFITQPQQPAMAPLNDMTGQLRTAESALAYILAGKAKVTVRSKATGTRYTYLVTKADPNPQYPLSVTYFVALLTGSDNTEDFTYLGIVRNNVFTLTRKSKLPITAQPVKAFGWVFGNLTRRVLPHSLEVWHEGTCGRCGRPLTVPESIASGIGPVCEGKGGL